MSRQRTLQSISRCCPHASPVRTTSAAFPRQPCFYSRGASSTSPLRQPLPQYQFPLRLSHLLIVVPAAAAIAGGIFYLTDIRPAQKRFAAKQAVAQAQAASSVVEILPPETEEVIDPSTGIAFPTQIDPPGTISKERLRLVGTGVRVVSFLSVKVYAAGLYVEPALLRRAKSIPGWENGVTRDSLLAQPSEDYAPGEAPVPKPQSRSGEALMKNLIDQPSTFVLRIVPARATDFSHLRDGFYRSLVARLKLATQSGELSEADSEQIAASISNLKQLFPSGTKVPKGSPLLLVKTPSATLSIEYAGKSFGEVKDPWVAQELLLAYFSDKAPLSEKLKASVADGLGRVLEPREKEGLA